VIADFTESTFQGYSAHAGQSPIGTFRGLDGRWRAKFDAQEWDTVNGYAQTISNPIAGTITMAGTLTWTVTAAGMTGSPRAGTTNVFVGETPAIYGPRLASDLNADSDVGAFFTASYSGGRLTLVAKTPVANDATMNTALADGTATGFTASPTSTQDQAGGDPIAINEVAFGVYATDAGNTVLRGAAAFATPFALTAPYQGVTTWPDIPYGG
jgi:hypothetical protein